MTTTHDNFRVYLRSFNEARMGQAPTLAKVEDAAGVAACALGTLDGTAQPPKPRTRADVDAEIARLLA